MQAGVCGQRSNARVRRRPSAIEGRVFRKRSQSSTRGSNARRARNARLLLAARGINAIHDDIEFISYSPIKVFPFLGHRRGKPAMSEALRGATEAFEFVACEPISIVIELENAAVMLFTRGVSRVTGRSVQGMLAHFMRFRDGKIVELREFMDSFHAAEQALGRELIEGL